MDDELDPVVDESGEPDAGDEAAPDPVAEAPAFQLDEGRWTAVEQFVQQSGPVMSQLAEILSAPQAEAQQGEQEIDYDPFDPESVQRFVDARAEAMAERMMEPFKGLLGMISEREGETLAKAELERIKGEVGEFDQDMAYMVASGMLQPGVDPAQALQVSAKHIHEYETRIRSDERAKVEAELRGLGEAPSQGGTGSGTAEPALPVPTGPNRYEEAINRVLANRRASLPVG